MKRSQLLASYLVTLLSRAALSPLKLLPVKSKRALFLSFRGKQYSCNPRAISEKLGSIAGGRVEIVWAFHEPERFRKLVPQGVKVISDRGFKFIYYALTSRVVCTNTYYKPHIPRRRAQFYLRTWHGGGAYKKVSYPKGLMGRYIRLQQQGASLYLSSSEAFTKMTLRESFGYKGEVLEAGMPRNDPLVNGDWRRIAENVRRELGLEGKKICLYAPTYREKDKKVPKVPDAERLRDALKERFGGEWVLLSRGHHADKNGVPFASDMDVSAYPDMQPLLMAADALITDYSSCIWDAALVPKSVFLFVPDIDEYLSDRDFYTPIDTWGFPVSKDDDALISNILAFDEAAYQKRVSAALAKLGNRETGRASLLAAERIMRECVGK